MEPASREIGGLPVLCFSLIDERHRPTERCRHVGPDGLIGPARGLAVCGWPGEPVFLFRCDKDWMPLADTWHSSAAEARVQAEFEYEGVQETWRSEWEE